MDDRISESETLQSAAGSHYGSRPYYRDGNGIIPLQANDGKEKEQNVKRSPAGAPEFAGKREGEFLRHEQIYRSDVVFKVRDEAHSGFAPIPSFR